MRVRPSNDEYFLDIAKVVSSRSTCMRRLYGAVVVNKNNRIVGTGYNGAPVGKTNCIDDNKCDRQMNGVPRGERYEMCRGVHAEQNACIQSGIQEGGTLYLYCYDLESSKEDEDPKPCQICANIIDNCLITRIVTKKILLDHKNGVIGYKSASNCNHKCLGLCNNC